MVHHLPPARANPSWANTYPHPQLVVYLIPLKLTVIKADDSDDEKSKTRIFQKGDIILLEYVDR